MSESDKNEAERRMLEVLLAEEFESGGAARQAEAIFVTLLMGLSATGDLPQARALVARGREYFSSGGSRHLLAMFLRHAAENLATPLDIRLEQAAVIRPILGDDPVVGAACR